MLSPRHANPVTPRSAVRSVLPANLKVATLVAFWLPSAHACLDHAAARYGISPTLLRSIAFVESRLKPDAVNDSHRHRTGSYDIGLMQINSSHLKALAKHGIREADLFDACTNLMVGAWILSDLFRLHGVTWKAIGAYNASCSTLSKQACSVARSRYAWKVYRHLESAERQGARTTARVAP